MERVVFIVEGDEQQIPCLLNPESLLLQRKAGVKNSLPGGSVSHGINQADNPLLFNGGGVTYLTMNLLFDVNISGVQSTEKDVRKMTGPLWLLSENQPRSEGGRGHPAVVRFVWGKAFNFPGVIIDIAERLELFDAEGTPQRSFLRLRMRRVREHSEDMSGGAVAPPDLPEDFNLDPPLLEDGVVTHAVVGAAAGDLAASAGGESERIDQLAYYKYGDPSLWRLIAWINNIDFPEMLEPGIVLKTPSREDLKQ